MKDRLSMNQMTSRINDIIVKILDVSTIDNEGVPDNEVITLMVEFLSDIPKSVIHERDWQVLRGKVAMALGMLVVERGFQAIGSFAASYASSITFAEEMRRVDGW